MRLTNMAWYDFFTYQIYWAPTVFQVLCQILKNTLLLVCLWFGKNKLTSAQWNFNLISLKTQKPGGFTAYERGLDFPIRVYLSKLNAYLFWKDSPVKKRCVCVGGGAGTGTGQDYRGQARLLLPAWGDFPSDCFSLCKKDFALTHKVAGWNK